VAEGLQAALKLEMKQFATRGPIGGYTITRLGARVARALVATTEADEIPENDGRLTSGIAATSRK
jgi:hypothetical protein